MFVASGVNKANVGLKVHETLVKFLDYFALRLAKCHKAEG